MEISSSAIGRVHRSFIDIVPLYDGFCSAGVSPDLLTLFTVRGAGSQILDNQTQLRHDLHLRVPHSLRFSFLQRVRV